MLVLGRRHLERILGIYTAHYNGRRPHRGLELKTPDPLVELYRINPVTRTVEATVGVGRGTTGLGEGGGVSLAAAATSGDSVWVYNDFERILGRVDLATNVLVETLPVGSCCSAGLPPGMAVGYGALWVTGDDDLMRVTLFGA
jgi:hypothetical protein